MFFWKSSIILRTAVLRNSCGRMLLVFHKRVGDTLWSVSFFGRNIREPVDYSPFLSNGSAINFLLRKVLRVKTKMYTFFIINSIFHLNFCLIVANQNSCIFMKWNQLPFFFNNHRLAYAVENKNINLS